MIGTQKNELLSRQKADTLQAHRTADSEIKKQTKEKQIRLIECSKRIIDSGITVTEAFSQYYIMVHFINVCEDQSLIHSIDSIPNVSYNFNLDSDTDSDSSSPQSGKVDHKNNVEREESVLITMLHSTIKSQNIDSEEILAYEKEWKAKVAGELFIELEEALRAGNTEVMEQQQFKYALNSDNKDKIYELVKLIEYNITKIESIYPKLHILEGRRPENVQYLTNTTVNLTIGLDLFCEATHLMFNEGFDLSEMIQLSLSHPMCQLLLCLHLIGENWENMEQPCVLL